MHIDRKPIEENASEPETPTTSAMDTASPPVAPASLIICLPFRQPRERERFCARVVSGLGRRRVICGRLHCLRRYPEGGTAQTLPCILQWRFRTKYRARRGDTGIGMRFLAHRYNLCVVQSTVVVQGAVLWGQNRPHLILGTRLICRGWIPISQDLFATCRLKWE